MFAMVTLLKLRIIQLRITNLGALLNYRSSITKLRWVFGNHYIPCKLWFKHQYQ